MLTRRYFLGAGAATFIAAPSILRAQVRWKADPFSLGVASGDPVPDGFVLWTRLAPDPLSRDPNTPGGMSGGAVPVRYEVASDPAMRSIVRNGTAMAQAEDAW